MLKRFLITQDGDDFYPSYEEALSEIRNGHKDSHWIWYIFPQLKELGISGRARFYGIRDLDEAKEYLAEPTLRARLLEISRALLDLPGNDPRKVMDPPDDLKLRSCMTLFAAADPGCPVFQQVLDKYYNGEPDQRTLSLLK